jgi:Arc/MetJ-type ribon-helix-helix transcriptional regulator
MKIKVSVSMEDKTLDDVENKVDEGLFRNKSHFIEYAVKKCLEGDQ